MAKSNRKHRELMRFPFRGVDASVVAAAVQDGAAPYILNVFPRAQDGGASDPTRGQYCGAARPGLANINTVVLSGNTFNVVGMYLWETRFTTGATTSLLIAMTDDSTALNRLQSAVIGSGISNAAQITNAASSAVTLFPTFAPLGNRLYYVGTTHASRSYLQTTALNFPEWFLWSATSGALLPDFDLCCTYQARIVTAKTGDSLFRISAVGNGQNMDSSPTTPSAAYDGNATGQAGIPGDIITALIPFGDDYMFFGAASSVHRLVGNPRFGGSVKPITTKVGVLWRNGWCFDPYGNMWFVGSDYGLYVVAKGSDSFKEVLRGRVDPWMSGQLRDRTKVPVLAYDTQNKMVLVMIVPKTIAAGTAPAAAVHVAYNPDLDAPFLFQFTQNTPPYSVVAFDDGRVLFGGRAGYTGWIPGTATVQDRDQVAAASANYSCIIKWPIIDIDGGMTEWMAQELQAIGTSGTGAASWYLLSGQSADQVALVDYATGSVASGTVFATAAGFQQPVGIRQTAAAHQLVIAQTANADLRLDQFTLDFEAQSRRRIGS